MREGQSSIPAVAISLSLSLPVTVFQFSGFIRSTLLGTVFQWQPVIIILINIGYMPAVR